MRISNQLCKFDGKECFSFPLCLFKHHDLVNGIRNDQVQALRRNQSNPLLLMKPVGGMESMVKESEREGGNGVGTPPKLNQTHTLVIKELTETRGETRVNKS